jgi:hypothetical protein
VHLPLSPQASAVEAECSIETTDEPDQPREPAATPPREQTKASNRKADRLMEDLVTHEVEYQEISEALKREEEKLNERRKRAGGSVAKSKKLVEDTFELDALKRFNELRIKYHRVNAKKPNLKKRSPSLEASTVIAKRLGKSDHYARRLREKLAYLRRVGELQISRRGKGATHQSLLSDPRIVGAIRTWAKGAVPVEKGGYGDRVWCFGLKVENVLKFSRFDHRNYKSMSTSTFSLNLASTGQSVNEPPLDG